jgi:hypothetical protein
MMPKCSGVSIQESRELLKKENLRLPKAKVVQEKIWVFFLSLRVCL